MKRRILSWILAACLTVGTVTVAAAAPTPTEAAQSETMQTAASPWEKVSFVDIYNDPNKFSTISNAENGNVPKIDESVQSLGWLGTGACVAVKGFGFGAGIPDGVQLKVEMSRDLGEIEGAYHFAVCAVPSGQSVTGAGDLTEGQKIAVQPVLPSLAGSHQVFHCIIRKLRSMHQPHHRCRAECTWMEIWRWNLMCSMRKATQTISGVVCNLDYGAGSVYSL